MGNLNLFHRQCPILKTIRILLFSSLTNQPVTRSSYRIDADLLSKDGQRLCGESCWALDLKSCRSRNCPRSNFAFLKKIWFVFLTIFPNGLLYGKIISTPILSRISFQENNNCWPANSYKIHSTSSIRDSTIKDFCKFLRNLYFPIKEAFENFNELVFRKS